MAKNNKVDINKNFENLKAQMKKKKEIAESIEEDVRETSEVERTDQYTDINGENNTGYDEEIVSVPEFMGGNSNGISSNTNNNAYNNTHNSTNNNFGNYNNYIETERQQPEAGNVEYTARKTGMVSDININKIIIKKVEKQEQPKRITYYLKPETIKKIDKFSRLSGMGKSEFVQKILDEVLNNLEIER